MEGRRRTIELAEDVAVALEQRAAERGVSLADHLSDLAGRKPEEIDLSPEDRTDLDARRADWEERRLGVPLDEVAEWMKSWGRPDELPRPRARRL